MTQRDVVTAYGDRAEEYADLLGSMEATNERDRRLVAAWAATVTGTILDVGCGPGHWTAFLHDQGREGRGIDPVPQFVEIARAAHPKVSYELGTFEDLPVNAAGGILAWYSMIHLPPERLVKALMRCHSALAPDGSLLMAFFTGSQLERFDHAVTPAYYWPMRRLKELLAEVGFTYLESEERHDVGARPHGAILACRL